MICDQSGSIKESFKEIGFIVPQSSNIGFAVAEACNTSYTAMRHFVEIAAFVLYVLTATQVADEHNLIITLND